ncbi:MAG: hypothetical protein IT307_19645 [Chloroflexi bacterium]|nr:hypothetical protein [Chloroflexota bacterium]
MPALLLGVLILCGCGLRRPAIPFSTPTPDLPPLGAGEIVNRLTAALDHTTATHLSGKSTGTGSDDSIEIVSTRGARSITRASGDFVQEEIHLGDVVWTRQAGGEWARQPATAGALFTTYLPEEWKRSLATGTVEVKGIEPLLNRRVYVLEAQTDAALWIETYTWWIDDDQFLPSRLRMVRVIKASGRENRLEAQVDFRARQIKAPR